MPATISGDGTSTLINLTTSGNTVLGDASTDTLNVGNGGLVKDASGNVGIGTSSPSAKLNVAGVIQSGVTGVDGTVTYARSSDGAAAASMGYLTATTEVKLNNALSGPMTFYTSNTERMRIGSTGSLLVGNTVSPTSAGNAGVEIYQSAGIGGMYFGKTYSGSTDAQRFYYNGGGSAVQVGSINYSNTATSFNTSSDYRLKENIQPMTGALAKVQALNPVTYTWKADGSDGQGFIAHELAEVEAGCVTGEKDAVDAEGNPVYQGIDTSFLVATLTAAIQELKAIVDAQAVEIAALKGTA